MSSELSLKIDDLERRFGVIDKQFAECGTHGQYVAVILKNAAKPSGCPVCADEIQKEKDREEQRAMFAKIAAEQLERKLGNSMIPFRFRDRTFEGYNAANGKQRKALETCRLYAEHFKDNYDAGRCLLLLGKPGTGKTHLAAAIAVHVIREKRGTAVYRTVTGILQHIKSSYEKGSDMTEAKAFETFLMPDLLVIDEIGATKPTDFELATLFTIINGRYEEQLPTVVISNLMPNELPDAMGERCVDRLREGGGIALVFDWESARKGAAA